MPASLRNLSSTVDVAVVDDDDDLQSTIKDTVRCKGVQRAVAQRIPFDEYKRTLETGLPRHDTTYGIRSREHKLHIERLFKLSLKLSDDKRYWTSPLTSISHGNPLAIKQLQQQKEQQQEASFVE